MHFVAINQSIKFNQSINIRLLGPKGHTKQNAGPNNIKTNTMQQNAISSSLVGL